MATTTEKSPGYVLASAANYAQKENAGPTTVAGASPERRAVRRKRPSPEGGKSDWQVDVQEERVRKYMEEKYNYVQAELEDSEKRRLRLAEKLDRTDLSEQEKRLRLLKFHQNENQRLNELRRRMSKEDFSSLATIGKGAFGEIRLAKMKSTKKIYALKVMRKEAMVRKNKVPHVRAERDCMAAADNPWIVKLFYSFHDTTNLYLVMEFLPGGDLMQLLMREDMLTEQHARFYFVETASAIAVVHQMGYIHRDLKPDNILLDQRGHIKLTDMGLARKVVRTDDVVDRMKKLKMIMPVGGARASSSLPESKTPLGAPCSSLTIMEVPETGETEERHIAVPTHRDRKLAYSMVGTPDFMAPEVLSNQGYGCDCDWWSLGVILYECLVGHTPFWAETPQDTCKRILSRQAHAVPAAVGATLSNGCKDMLQRLLRPSKSRLGRNGFAEIKEHPWVSDLDFDNLHDIEAPYVPANVEQIDSALKQLVNMDENEDPQLVNFLTTQVLCNFEEVDDANPSWMSGDNDATGDDLSKPYWQQDDEFIGFSFKRRVVRGRALSVDSQGQDGESVLSYFSVDEDRMMSLSMDENDETYGPGLRKNHPRLAVLAEKPGGESAGSSSFFNWSSFQQSSTTTATTTEDRSNPTSPGTPGETTQDNNFWAWPNMNMNISGAMTTDWSISGFFFGGKEAGAASAQQESKSIPHESPTVSDSIPSGRATPSAQEESGAKSPRSASSNSMRMALSPTRLLRRISSRSFTNLDALRSASPWREDFRAEEPPTKPPAGMPSAFVPIQRPVALVPDGAADAAPGGPGGESSTRRMHRPFRRKQQHKLMRFPSDSNLTSMKHMKASDAKPPAPLQWRSSSVEKF